MSYASHSHPDADERDASPAPRSMPHASSSKLINAELLADLVLYQREHGLTNKALGRELGYSESLMGRALAQVSGKPSKTGFNGDVAAFESKVRELFHKVEQRRQAPLHPLQKTGFLVAPMRAFLDSVAATGDIGIAFSPAGKGKTDGAKVWKLDNSLAVMVEASKELCGWRAIRDAIIEELPFSQRPRRGEKRGAFIKRLFHGSNRLLIIDNAHLITESARYWVAYDWNERTGCPVALIGNEIIQAQWGHREGIDANDQLSSRVGQAYEIRALADCMSDSVVLASMALHYPAAADDAEAVALAAEVLRNKGASRSLRKHLVLAQQMSSERAMPPAEAIRKANGILLSKKLAA